MISGKKLKQLRINNGWSQEQLSEISGLGVRTVQRIEKEDKCSLESKMALASAFSISPAELDNDNIKPVGKGAVNWGGILGFTLALLFSTKDVQNLVFTVVAK